MKLIDKIEEINNSITELIAKVENSQDIEEVKQLTEKLNALKDEKQTLENGEKNKVEKNYLETNAASKDFATIYQNSRNTEEFHNTWNAKLEENGVKITDEGGYLPKRIEMEIQTVLTRSNPVFPLFKISNQGAILYTRELTSADEAKVHIPGAKKEVQAATLKTSGIRPKMIYKMQSFDEIDKRTINNFGELYEVVVAELAQRVIDKVVDLALFEGSATDGETGSPETENGFISIKNEKDTNKVVHVNGQTDLVEALEEAVDAIDAPGKKYLIITKQQKRAIIKALRTKYPNSVFKSSNAELASEFGIDEIVIYNGTKAISPTVMAEGAYAVDMQPLNRVEQFKIDTNTNDVLVETPASGRAVAFGGIAVVDLA